MKPIQVEIINFQSIEKLSFEIKGFTCITGKTNIGKSAITRALSDAFLNTPVTSLVRKGAKFTSVQATSEDWDFRWEKGGGVSRYFIPSDSDKPLDKIGQGQIEPIANLGFRSVKLGAKNIFPWYADQFNPLFLINETGGTVTDFISEVSQLQTLQNAIVISGKQKRKAVEKAKLRAEDTAALKEKVQKVEGIQDLARVVTELEEQAKSIEDYERRLALGEKTLNKIETSKSFFMAVDGVSKVKVPSDPIEGMPGKLRRMISFNNELIARAQKVIAVKAIASVKIPDFDEDSFKKLVAAKRFLSIGPLQASLNAVSGISKVKVPDSGSLADDIKKLSRMNELQTKLETSAQKIRAANVKVEVPSDPGEDIRKLSRMIKFQARIEKLRKEDEDLALQESEIQSQIEEVTASISLVPSCKTCGRVATHDHA